MKSYHSIIAGLCFLLASCAVPVTYFGDRLAPTSTVDIYYSAHDVKKEYKVIGHLTCPNWRDQEKVKAELSKYARSIGADAVVIVGTGAVGDAKAALVNADALKYN